MVQGARFVVLACAVVLLGTAGAAQTTTIATLSSSGAQSDDGSLYAEITPDGRYVAYQSTATNLVPGDANGQPDVFVRDTWLGTTTRASVGSAGQEADDDCLEPAISADGRYLVYFAYATNLVPGDTNNYPDVFVRDLVAGTTICASVDSNGVLSDGGSRYPTISGDGRWVAFECNGTNLVAGDTNGFRDVFVHDLQTAATARASVGAAGQEADSLCLDASISHDGRYVAFESDATNLVPGDTNGVLDVFLRDLLLGTTVRVSLGAAAQEGNGASADPCVSADGRYVSFGSSASNLVAGDTNGEDDIFVRDVLLGTTVRASVSSSGGESDWDAYDAALSPDGRYVVFFSAASNLVAGDSNGVEDIYLRDLVLGTTERSSVGSLGQGGNGWCHYPAVSADGRFVAFDSVSTNLVLGDSNGQRDIFVRDRAPSFHLYCPGDGTLPTACPCGNSGATGQGCENSAATGGARLQVFGVTIPDMVRLDASGELPSALSIFLQGDASNPSGVVFGDGLRCAVGNLKRLYAKNAVGGSVSAPVSGDPSITSRSAALGDTIPAGGTRYYQVYYRDANGAWCPSATFNITNGVRIGW